MLPTSIYRDSNFLKNKLLGIPKDNQENLDKIYKNLPSDDFFKWAFHSSMAWDNKEVPKNLVHIHGELDKILPIKNIKNPVSVKGAGHLMFCYKAKTISRLIQAHLN